MTLWGECEYKYTYRTWSSCIHMTATRIFWDFRLQSMTRKTKYKHMHNLRIVSSVKQSRTVYMVCCTLAAHHVLCRTHNSTCLWIVFELTHDTIVHKIRVASDLWHDVWYRQTDILSSNSTRWGSPQYGRYWMVIIIFTNLYLLCKLQHKMYPLYFDVVSGSDRFQQLHLSCDAYAPH